MRAFLRAIQAALAVTAVAPPAGADTAGAPVSAVDLLEQCREYGSERDSPRSAACESYIRGFLGGARERDSLEATCPSGEESFARRAARTRLGIDRRAPPPLYCVADDTPIEQLVADLIAHGESHPGAEDLSASELLAQLLRSVYPCDC
jgi:hypothetical protein